MNFECNLFWGAPDQTQAGNMKHPHQLIWHIRENMPGKLFCLWAPADWLSRHEKPRREQIHSGM